MARFRELRSKWIIRKSSIFETGKIKMLKSAEVRLRIMSKLFACIISESTNRDEAALLSVAQNFSPHIERLDDGVLFDVSGLTRLIGDADEVARNIVKEMRRRNVAGKVSVAENAETAMLLARSRGASELVNPIYEFTDLPLRQIDIGADTLNVFNDLGIHRVHDLLAVPTDELVKRYGREFERVVRTIRQKGDRCVVPNIKETDVSWSYELDFAVEDFEQLIFVVNRGFDQLFDRVAYEGLSTEQIDITLNLRKKEAKFYEIKTSFPTLEKSFWLKLVNLRIALDPPESEIVSVRVIAHFAKPRPDQRGLYAVSRPEPESLLLTVNKLKKLVGETEVGVPVLLNQRLAKPFALDADKLPVGHEQNSPRLRHSICGEACPTDEAIKLSAAVPPPKQNGGRAANLFQTATEKHSFSANRAAEPPSSINCNRGVIAFNYFRPMIRASVVVRDGRLVHLKTRAFRGSVVEYSGVWRANSRWWERPWSVEEWDVEVENHGLYRLRFARQEWFLVGEYD